ncbi:hypothetical protein [Methylobacterium nigriterrae]|uniref:hypothetical protein n=1 Tax=Methylobacterium nigriterrae TaxID=3127512 RepID=UPI003013E562
MDVVVTPVGSAQSAGGTWRLEDRLGRVLGAIRQIPWTNEFSIVSEPGSRLYGVPALHASLDAALTAIEKRLGGTCELVGGPEH